MSIQERKQGQEIPALGHFDHLPNADENRRVLRTAVFGETGAYPAMQRAHKILDGDYSYSSTDVKVPNKGS